MPDEKLPVKRKPAVKKTVEQLRQEMEAELKALKEKQAKKLKQAKALENRRTAGERNRQRKQETHIKILFGGFLMAQIKRTKDVSIIDKVMPTVNDKDKEQLKALKVSIQQPSVKTPETK